MSPFIDILRGGFPLFILEKFEEKSMNPLRTPMHTSNVFDVHLGDWRITFY